MRLSANIIVLTLIGLLIALSGVCPAFATTYTSSGATEFGIGAQPPYDTYDILTLTSVSSSINGSGTYLLSDVSFSEGVNCTTCTPVTGNISETLTIGGDVQSITIPWSWSSTGPTDTINLLSNGPYSFDTGQYLVSVLAAGPFSESNDGTATGVLDMTVTATTPLPAALPLFAGGLGLIGLLRAQKRRKAQAALTTKHAQPA